MSARSRHHFLIGFLLGTVLALAGYFVLWPLLWHSARDYGEVLTFQLGTRPKSLRDIDALHYARVTLAREDKLVSEWKAQSTGLGSNSVLYAPAGDDSGYILFRNSQTGRWRMVWFHLDGDTLTCQSANPK